MSAAAPRFVLTRSNGGKPAAPPPPVAPPPQTGGCGHSHAPAAAPAVETPTVRVNGVEIAPAEIAREAQHHPAPAPAEAWREAARALAVRELLLQEARALDLRPEPEGDGVASETPEEALVRQLLEQALEPAAADEAECRRVYAAQAERFRTPDLFEAGHILIEPDGEGEAAWSAAEARARRLVEIIGEGHDAFAAAAREHSACPSAQQDGSLGQVRRGELAAPVQAALERLADGETLREPVRSRFGWHLLRLERRIPGRVLPYEAVAERIRDMLEARAWAVSAAQFVAALAERAEVEGVELVPPSGACSGDGGC